MRTKIKFDSNEYWQANTWDRFSELKKVKPAVREIFLEQEQFLLEAVEKVLQSAKTGYETCPVYVLDLACGTGRLSKLIVEKWGGQVRIDMVDFNPHTLDIALKNLIGYPQVSAICTDVNKVCQLSENPYDIIICFELFHHLSDLDSVFSAITKVLSSGGILIGNVFHNERYLDFDRLKYGKYRSIKRSFFFHFGNILYKIGSSSVKGSIRKWGWSRIAPVNSKEFLELLHQYFQNKIEIHNNYYFFFVATAK